MNNITTISFYDMDGCLINTPLPDEGKLIWQEKTGTPYPYQGWWGRPETLDIRIFDIKPFPNVLNKLRQDQTKKDTYTVLLTSRIIKLKPQIELILKQNNITLDDLSLKTSEETKVDRIKIYLHKFSNVNTINVYDDREKEIADFIKFKNEFGDKYQININKVNNDKIIPVSNKTVIESIIFEEISIYFKEKHSK